MTTFIRHKKELASDNEYSSAATAVQVATTGEQYIPTSFNYTFKSKYQLVRLEPVADDDWFNEPSWIEGEKEADEDLKMGRTVKCNNAREALAFLSS
jgi:hypothetical protein